MKWSFLGLIGLAVFSFANAASLHISRVSLGQPFYRSIKILSMSSQNQDTGNIAIKFLDKNGKTLQIENGLKVKRMDWESCSLGFCIHNLYELPLPLEKYSCSIEFNFVSSAGISILTSRENWGDCISAPALPGEKFLPDFTFPNNAYLSDEGSIEIKNIGSSHSELSLSVWGFLKDREGNFIWSGNYQANVVIQSQGKLLITFEESFKLWQKKLACSGMLIIDPSASSFERSKLNNLLTFEFGECEIPPTEARGDKIDFLPVVLVENGVLKLDAKNQGRLPFLGETSHLEASIRYLGSKRELIFKKTFFTSSRIYGFGDSKKVVSDVIPAGTCFIEIELNPNLTIKENNYLNNRTELKICE